MKSIKKVMAVALAGLILTGALTGCFGGKSGGSSDGVATLVWYLPGDKEPDLKSVLDAVNKITEEKINVKLDIQFVDMGTYNNRMSMASAAGSDFDLCYTSNWINSFIENAKKGAYAPLNELINEHAPLLKSELPDYIWNASTIDGVIYGVPHLQVLFYQTAYAVFKPYADKYGLDPAAIKTAKDLEPFLAKVKQGEPNIYPYRAAGGVNHIINPKYELITPDGMGLAVRKDGDGSEVIQIEDTEEYKSGIKLMRDWYEKGYIRPDIATVMDDEVQDLTLGKYAVYQTIWKPGAEAEEGTRYGEEVIMIPIEEPYLQANAGMSAITAINRTSKKQEQAIKFLELVNTDAELFNLLCFGIEGKHYNLDSDGKVVINKEGGYTPNAAWKMGNQFNALYMQGQEDGTWELTKQLNDSSIRSPIMGFLPDTDPIRNEISQIGSVHQEYKIIRVGGDDPEKLYQPYIDKLKVAGRDKVRAEVQKQLDERKAANR